MTLKNISDQIATIKDATERAAVSPETALDFLHKAGIVVISTKRGDTDAPAYVQETVRTSSGTWAVRNSAVKHAGTSSGAVKFKGVKKIK